MQEVLQTILSHSEIGQLFALSNRGDNNRRILVNNGLNGKPQRNGPNRVVQFPGKVVLVNYLTEQSEDTDQTKMQSFIKLYHQMGYSVVEGWLVSVSDCGVVKMN
jgi:ATP-dependent helicase/nuclease subunit A